MLSSGIIHNICDICVLLVPTSRSSTKSSKRYVIRKLLRVVTTHAANSLTNKQPMRETFKNRLRGACRKYMNTIHIFYVHLLLNWPKLHLLLELSHHQRRGLEPQLFLVSPCVTFSHMVWHKTIRYILIQFDLIWFDLIWFDWLTSWWIYWLIDGVIDWLIG